MSDYRIGVDRQTSTTTGGSHGTPPGHMITEGRDHAWARLKGIGFTGADLACPIVGVANTWIEAMPCNNTSYKKSTYMIKDTSMSESIGFIGLGNMGQPMAQNLLKAGFQLRVYNRNASKAAPLVAEGAQLFSHPSEVVEPGGIVITMVANDDALESVVLGEEGFLKRLGPGGIHLSMSTISPATARKLADLHTKQGSMYVAAPVFGRPDAAAAQKLWICVSGPQAAKGRVQPILNALGQGVFDFGEEPGAANVVKLAGNFLIVAAMEAMAEALTLAEKNGLDRSRVIDMFAQTSFACPIYQNYGKVIAQKRYTPAGFHLSLGFKDVGLVLQTADDVKMPMPFASLLHDRLIASIARGRGDMDWSALALAVSEDAGLG